jgi:hypothetical protein
MDLSTSTTPWIDGKPKNSLNSATNIAKFSLFGHLIWFFKTMLITYTNQMECRLDNNEIFVTLEACYSMSKLVKRACNTNWQVLGTISCVKLFSNKCLNFIVNQPTNSLLTLKCSIDFKSLYCVVRKWKYQIVDSPFTHLLKSWLNINL